MSQMGVGQGFPEIAEGTVPADYIQTHGLILYVIPMIAPQVLLIYFDEEGRVMFVSSAPT